MWPNGSFEITFPADKAPHGWDKSSWAWENRRKHKDTGLTKYHCRGVWCCVHCPWKLRPCIRKQDLAAQTKRTCGFCKGKLLYVSCHAEVFKTVTKTSYTYQHVGLHTHPYPPEGKAHPQHVALLQKVIKENPNTRPQALITGSSFTTNSDMANFRSSESVGNIAPQFNNSSRVAAIRKQTLSNDSIMITSTKGSDAFLLDYMNFQQNCPNFTKQLILKTDIAIISVQTEFMEHLLSVYRQDIVDQFGNDIDVQEEIPMLFNHGCVTDAAHKFFQNGKLLVTCCYFEVMHRWEPIFLSWVGRQTAKTYQQHFFKLFESIGNGLRDINGNKSLWRLFQQIIGMVVDFSDAQRAGFQAAYAEFMAHTAVGIKCQLSNWTDDKQPDGEVLFSSYQENYDFGGSLLKGCEYHWHKSVNRIARNCNLIPDGQESEFRGLVAMLSTVSTMVEFNSTARLIYTEFPNVKHWLEWWLQGERSCLLFLAVKTSLGETFNENLPGIPIAQFIRKLIIIETSNAVESVHFKIYNGCGLGKGAPRLGVLEGLQRLFLYCTQIEKMYALALGTPNS